MILPQQLQGIIGTGIIVMGIIRTRIIGTGIIGTGIIGTGTIGMGIIGMGIIGTGRVWGARGEFWGLGVLGVAVLGWQQSMARAPKYPNGSAGIVPLAWPTGDPSAPSSSLPVYPSSSPPIPLS